MLNQLRQILRKRIKSGNVRSGWRSLCFFERLEDRALLSASSGKMANGLGKPEFGGSGGVGPSRNESTPYVLQAQLFSSRSAQIHVASNDGTGPGRGAAGANPGNSGVQNHPVKQSGTPPGFDVRSIHSIHWANSAREQDAAAPAAPAPSLAPLAQPAQQSLPPPSTPVITSRPPAPVHSAMASPKPIHPPAHATRDSFVDRPQSAPLPSYSVTPAFQPTYPSAPSWVPFDVQTPSVRPEPAAQPVATSDVRMPTAMPSRPSAVSPTIIYVVVPAFMPPASSLVIHTGTSIPNSNALPPSPISSAPGATAFATALAGIPAAQPIMWHEINWIANASVAYDMAFHNFWPRIPFAAAGNSYDRPGMGSWDTDAAAWETADGFILPPGQSMLDENADSADVLAREGEAIDAVLRELRGIGALAEAMHDELAAQAEEARSDQLADGQIEAIALEEMPDGLVDGGMVLLESTGGPNESGFDLAPVYAEQIASVGARADMEASVGLYHAVDVVIDESASADTGPAAWNMDSSGKHEFDAIRSQAPATSSFEQAAVLVGATTVGGAMVWMNRNRSRGSTGDAAAKKRRAGRD